MLKQKKKHLKYPEITGLRDLYRCFEMHQEKVEILRTNFSHYTFLIYTNFLGDLQTMHLS